MERHPVNSNGSKSRIDSQIEVVTNWHHTEQVSPAFCKLMRLLLEPRPQPNSKKGVNDEAS